jgi:DNA polymerase III alpha subunit
MTLAIDEGIKISLPKIDKSLATKWTIEDNTLIMPLTDIDGIGEAQAEAIIKESKKKRKGFFKSSSSVNLPPKIKKLLEGVGAYSDKSNYGFNEIKKLQKFTPYNLLKIFNL